MLGVGGLKNKRIWGFGGSERLCESGVRGSRSFKNPGEGVFPARAFFNGTALMNFSGVKAFLIAILGDIGSYQMTMNWT